ncbi:DMT family transporter [Albirhodobacter sp. R86504]|uniref:DMT family transporter n=1 Tax=Albirhodobacter sp. R86504 TaxID=3093848 RepID=UPI00366FC034
MTLTVFLATLCAAFFHALWNAFLRTKGSKISAMTRLSLFEIPIGLMVVAVLPMPNLAAWPWVLAAGCVHFIYKSFLALAYEQGDLSRVYPIARGAAPMAVALFSAAFLADQIAPQGYAGIVVLGLGILLMARGIFTDGESRRLLPFALGSAAATAVYTVVDGMGARIAGDAVAYIGWTYIIDGILFAGGMTLWRGTACLRAARRDWLLACAGSIASFIAYATSIWAMTQAPIAVVAALRETSILFAVLIGWLWFGERMSRNKAIAALLIVAGVIITRL